MTLSQSPNSAFLDQLADLAGEPADPAAGALADGDLTHCSAVAAVRAMRAGALRCADYTAALLGAAQAQADLNAFRTLDVDQLLSAAHAADRRQAGGGADGLLHGLPVPVKDSVDSADLPTSNGTAALRDFQPAENAELLERLFGAGALLMGKTNLHELSYGWTSNNLTFGAVRNPWDRSRIPGGSSGGSAAAVSARMAPLAVAEDTQGSIRVPASLCGLTGLRPSYGRYPGTGLMALTLDRFDQAGPLARSVADLVLFDAALTQDLRPLPVPALARVRLGVCRRLMLRHLDPGTEACVTHALAALAAAGVTLVDLDLAALVREAMDVAMILIARETRPAMDAYLERSATGIRFEDLLAQVGADVRGMLLDVAGAPGRPDAAAHRDALLRQGQLVRTLTRLWQDLQLDAIAYPATLCPALPIGDDGDVLVGTHWMSFGLAMARNTSLGSCARLASVVLPAGLSAQGLPVGLELAALRGQDRALLGLSLAVERVLGPLPAPPASACSPSGLTAA